MNADAIIWLDDNSYYLVYKNESGDLAVNFLTHYELLKNIKYKQILYFDWSIKI